jgi:AcrR family transcriptional regulator
MQPVPARLLRASLLEAGIELPPPTKSEIEKRPKILAAARAVFATAWFYDVKLSKFAKQLHMSPETVARIFLDMESILAEILHEHLNAVAAAVDAVPADTPDILIARRAAYFAATRQRNNDYVPDHKLFLQQHGALPPDLKGPVKALHTAIGLRLSQDGSDIAIAMLDAPRNTLFGAERMIAAIPPRAKPLPNPTVTIDWSKPADLTDGQPPTPRKPTLH